MKRAAIVDPDNDLDTIANVGHACVRGDRQRRMRGSHLVHVVNFAGRSFLAMEFLAIPASQPALLERPVVDNWRVGFAEYRVRAVPLFGISFDSRFGIRYGLQSIRRRSARAVVFIITAATGTGRWQHWQRFGARSR